MGSTGDRIGRKEKTALNPTDLLLVSGNINSRMKYM
jgi:hypothetical protein